MKGAARVLVVLAGGALIALLMRRVPDDVFAATQATLLVVASAILLLVAASMLFLPARRLSQAIFALPLRVEGPTFGLPREKDVRIVLAPLLVAGICVGIDLLASLLRR